MQPFSALHATAIAYAKAGVPVFPCEAGGKRPATENGFKNATTDLDIINAWWSENHDYNLAICPEDAGMFVIDIDPGAKSTFISRLPETYTVRTPRNGWHLYFAGSGRSTSNKLSAHVDTRGVGGYVLVPPSRTADGAYRLDKDVAYAMLPQWVTDAIAVVDTPHAASVEDEDLPENIDRAVKALEKYVMLGDVAIEGGGGDTRTYQLCCEMFDLGLSHEKAKDLIETIWNPHCQPPWEPEELETKLYNASQHKQNQTGAYGIESPVKVFGDIAKTIEPEPEKHSRFYFKDEEEIDAEADPTWIIKDLISERSTVMMYGTSGSYKSFMALEIALAVATGVDTFGSKTKKGKVFYGALEGKAHLKKGRHAWRTLKGITGKIENFFVGIAPTISRDGDIDEFIQQIIHRCQGVKPRLIIIDTLSKAMAGLNENDASDANRFITFCDMLVEIFGCSVMSIHHASDKSEGRGARGSSAFKAGFDTVLEVQAWKNTKAVLVRVEKHKDAEEREKPWTFEGRVTGPSLTFEATTPEQHKALVGESSEITPRKVTAVLQKLKAIGEDNAQTTAVIATELTPAKENESVEERAESISRTGRILTGQAKMGEKLDGFALKRGKHLLWFLPHQV